VERPRRAVRFARLIHRPVRDLGGPAVRAAAAANSSLPWLPRRVIRRPTLSRVPSPAIGTRLGITDLPSLTDVRDHHGPGRTPASAAIDTGACFGVTKATATDACQDLSGQFGDRLPKWEGSAMTRRSEVTRDHLC